MNIETPKEEELNFIEDTNLDINLLKSNFIIINEEIKEIQKIVKYFRLKAINSLMLSMKQKLTAKGYGAITKNLIKFSADLSKSTSELMQIISEGMIFLSDLVKLDLKILKFEALSELVDENIQKFLIESLVNSNLKRTAFLSQLNHNVKELKKNITITKNMCTSGRKTTFQAKIEAVNASESSNGFSLAAEESEAAIMQILKKIKKIAKLEYGDDDEKSYYDL